MEIIKELGANLVRTAHSIQDKSLMEAADDLGLLVLDVEARNRDYRRERFIARPERREVHSQGPELELIR